jgi:hypothetical protein
MPIVPIRTNTLTDRQFMDLLCLARDSMDDGKLEVALIDQTFHFLDLFADKVKMKGGTNISGQISLDEGGNAQWTDLFGTKTPAVADHTAPYTVPWKHITTDWSYDRREPEMQGTEEEIFDIIENRRIQEMQRFCRMIENAAWTFPTSPTSPEVWGFPTWLTKAEGATSGGFYGGRPDGGTNWSSVAGIIPATANDGQSTVSGGKDLWRSYVASYTAVNTELLKRIRRAFKYCDFEAPRQMKLADAISKSQYRVFADLDNVVELESLAEQRNENFGSQLIMYEGTSMLGRAPVFGVKQLDSDADDPFYGINFSKFELLAMNGEYFRLGDPRRRDAQPSVVTLDLDLSFQIRCLNRRNAGFCICQV